MGRFPDWRKHLTAALIGEKLEPRSVGVRGCGVKEAFNGLYDSQNRQNGRDSPVVSSSGLARAIHRSHQESEIARGSLNQEFLVHVLKASHIEPVQSAGIKLMREVPFDPLSPLPLQALAARGYKLNCVNGHRKDHTKETRWQSTSNSSTSCWRVIRSQKTS